MNMNTRLSRMAFAACLILALIGPRAHADQNTIPGTTLVPTAWYVADQGATLVNGAVGTWTDQSGNGNHAKQTSAVNRPTFVDDVLPNGKPTLRFDGTDRLLFTTPLLSQNWTCFTVARPNWDNNQKAFLCGGTGSFEWRVRRNLESPYGRQGVTRRAESSLANGIALVPTNAFTVLSARVADGATSDAITLRLGQASDGSTITGANTFTTATTEVGGVEVFRGDIAALVVFTNALTDVEIVAVEKYLYDWYTQFPATLITLR